MEPEDYRKLLFENITRAENIKRVIEAPLKKMTSKQDRLYLGMPNASEFRNIRSQRRFYL